jgi:hypothetical protein
MKSFSKYFVPFVVGIFSVFSLLVNVGPNDAMVRLSQWSQLPLIGSTVENLTFFSSNPWVLAVSFFSFGALSRHFLQDKWKKSDPWAEFSWGCKNLIAESKLGYDDIHLNAKLNVLRFNAQKLGVEFPKVQDGFTTFQSLHPYLHNVSSYIDSGNSSEIKAVAAHFALTP